MKKLPGEGRESAKIVAKWCPGHLRGCQNEVPGVQGSSRGGPGARRVPSGAPGHDFGAPRAPIWVPFWSIFLHVFRYFFEAISASFFDAVLGPSGVHFGSILETFRYPNFLIESVAFQRTSPGAPSHPRKVKKLDFHWTVVQNRGSTFSCPSASG